MLWISEYSPLPFVAADFVFLLWISDVLWIADSEYSPLPFVAAFVFRCSIEGRTLWTGLLFLTKQAALLIADCALNSRLLFE